MIGRMSPFDRRCHRRLYSVWIFLSSGAGDQETAGERAFSFTCSPVLSRLLYSPLANRAGPPQADDLSPQATALT